MMISDPRLPPPLPLALAEMVPPPSLFVHPSELHGQKHVARVLVHGLRLAKLTGNESEMPRLWASIYAHDLAREHDGTCMLHGRNAADRLDHMPEVIALYRRAGVTVDDLPAVKFAVSHHVGAPEPDRDHPLWSLTALLKDADGLDRVRLGDLDPSYLRFPETPAQIPFAERLFAETNFTLAPGPDYFERLWPIALDLMEGFRRC